MCLSGTLGCGQAEGYVKTLQVVQEPWLWHIPHVATALGKVLLWHIVFHCAPSARRAGGTMEPCCHPCAVPVLPSTFPSLPKDKQDGWSSLLRGDASFSSHPPVTHVTEEQPSEFWQFWLLHSRLHPSMGSVISRRRAWVLLGQRRGEAGARSLLCAISMLGSPPC